MKTRKITIVSSTDNSNQRVLNSTAKTLGELKQELDQIGVGYTNMTFYEGLNRIELVDNNSTLPASTVYKGETTTDLVFMLSPANKHIKSGIMTRKECYEFVKSNEVYAAEIKAKYGKNFTNLSTEELNKFVELKQQPKKQPKQPKKAKSCTCGTEKLINAIIAIADSMPMATKCQVYAALEMECPKGYDMSEVEEMFDFVN